jgi:NitT/TauT family transport system substrate-binding protein
MDFCKTHSPEEIAKVIAPQFEETDTETLTTIVTRYYEQDTWKENLIFEEDAFTLLQDILMEAGELEQFVPYEELVARGFSENAAQ